MNNEQGDIGEIIFKLAISRHYIFRPRELGDKWPVSDCYVELVAPKEKFHFIVQIKSSRQGYSNGRLKLTAPKKKINQLKNYYAPTYLAGVDVEDERVYLIPINKSVRKNISRLNTSFELTKANLKLLEKDVKDFWKSSGLKAHKTNFNHSI
jgi:hypothetical protein